MKYTDEQRLQRISNYAHRLEEYIQSHGVTKEDLISDYSIQWLVTTPLYNIGEHVYWLSDELKNQYPQIEWKMISGLRHRLVHDYDGTNWNIISEVVLEEIPVFVRQIEKALQSQEDNADDI